MHTDLRFAEGKNVSDVDLPATIVPDTHVLVQPAAAKMEPQVIASKPTEASALKVTSLCTPLQPLLPVAALILKMGSTRT